MQTPLHNTNGPANCAGSSHVRLKVCGVTKPEQAYALRRMGVGLLGLNFHPASPRFVSPEVACELVKAWGDPGSVVGLFVDRSACEILDLQTLTGFGIAQLHGDETDQTISDVAARLPVIKAYRVRDQNSLDQARAQIQRLHTSGVDLYAALIDGYSAVAHGGTGVSVAQELVLAARGLHPRLILAGGLTPVNLGERLGWITPWAVDVASGVEVAPGLKSLEAVAAMLHTIADNVAGG